MTQIHAVSATEDAVDEQVEQRRLAAKRKRGFMGLALVIVLAAAGYGTWWWLVGSRYVSTDNAYTAAELAVVTPALGGIVQTVSVVDTQSVKRGDVLVTLDDTDARLALAQAEASLALARRHVRGYQANDEMLTAQIMLNWRG